MLEFLTSASTKPLSKSAWTQLLDNYPAIKGMENVLVAPIMKTGMSPAMKTEISKRCMVVIKPWNRSPLTKVWRSARRIF